MIPGRRLLAAAASSAVVLAGCSAGSPAGSSDASGAAPRHRLVLQVSITVCPDGDTCMRGLTTAEVTARLGGTTLTRTTDVDGAVTFDFDRGGQVEVSVDDLAAGLPTTSRTFTVGEGTSSGEVVLGTVSWPSSFRTEPA